jgi:hypothetical protein
VREQRKAAQIGTARNVSALRFLLSHNLIIGYAVRYVKGYFRPLPSFYFRAYCVWALTASRSFLRRRFHIAICNAAGLDTLAAFDIVSSHSACVWSFQTLGL